MDSKRPPICETWWSSLWKLKAPPRTRLLMWTIMKNKIAIGDNLIKRSFHGPFWFCLCKISSEDIDHLFLKCPAVKELWVTICSNFPSLIHWRGLIVIEALVSWWFVASPPKARNIPVLTYCTIWIARNHYIFQNSAPHWPSISAHILSYYHIIPEEETISTPRHITPESINYSRPWAYFDGST